ncbi:MAG: phospho-sugar mutase [Clostridia bacterium]|nr:phospho-sugar mutase [Clostridia bacterium]
MDYKTEYQKWIDNKNLDGALRSELEGIDDIEMRERFACHLNFGTAGLRGILGAGINRMNIYVVRRATQGLAEYVKHAHGEEKGVAIAYDSRHMSKEFAAAAAQVLCANNVKTYLFSDMRPVPELSFTVRHLGCCAGVVITASHNPKIYNGYKVYGSDGGQMAPDAADVVTKAIERVDIFDRAKSMSLDEAQRCGMLEYICDEIDCAYLENVSSQAINRGIFDELTDFGVVYTPFHGTGIKLVPRIIEQMGMKNLIIVSEQSVPDGDFPTVKSPNPEDKEGFELAIRLAEKTNTDLIIGTDPDCDRVGIIVRSSGGEYVSLTGNQTGALLCDYILSASKERGTLPDNAVVVKTVVTTEMIRPIAAFYGARVDECLTGFKFIAEKIKDYETNNTGLYMFGFEESYGYLKGTYCRDKDAVVASMLICEMAAWYKKRGMTLYDAMQELYKKYGTFAEDVRNTYCEGVDGPAKIAAIIDNIRKNPPKEVGGISVTAVRDYQSGIITYRDGHTAPTNQIKNNMLYYELENGKGWFAIRPSGTEPKFKVYFGYCDKDADKAEAALSAIVQDVGRFTNN